MMYNAMKIGSGDCSALLSKRSSKKHFALVQKFVSGIFPKYNAKASPIDAFRGGALLEEAYFKTLNDDWYTQIKTVCPTMDVLVSSLDFARLQGGKIVEAIEMKSVNFDAFINIPKDEIERLEYIKSKYKDNYNQVQFQLLCTGLKYITFKQVVIYDARDDNANITRVFTPNEEVNTKIYPDKEIIGEIKKRARIFQKLKDEYKEA